MMRNTATAAALVSPAWAEEAWAEGEWVAGGEAGGNDLPSKKKSDRMARKFLPAFRKKPADGCLRFLRNSRSTRFTAVFKKSCAISTAWVSRLTKATLPDITNFC